MPSLPHPASSTRPPSLAARSSSWRLLVTSVARTRRRSRHAAANPAAGGAGDDAVPQQPQQQPQQPASEPPLWWEEKLERQKQQQQAAPGIKAVSWRQVAVQLLQLVVTIAALIVWPASLYPAGLFSSKVWLLFFVYCLFFGGGSVWRLLRFGPLAPRQKDQQAKSLRTRAAWLLFVAMMPVLHWGALGSYMRSRAAAAAAATAGSPAGGGGLVGSLSPYDLIGLWLLAGAVWLNWQAARHLGKAYDRVVQPEVLVTTGPYAYVQHPIYTSYLLLFSGYAMMLHGLGYALLSLVVCLLYYRSRVALEAGVLQQAFGQAYQTYAQRTKLFVPFVF